MEKQQNRMWLLCILSMLLLCTPIRSYAQGEAIIGQVVDETGEAVIGATVRLKGATTGTITDFDGNFSIPGKIGNTLIISYVGYTQLETKITKLTGNRFILKEDSEVLDEVVVVGMGTQKTQHYHGCCGYRKPRRYRQPSRNRLDQCTTR